MKPLFMVACSLLLIAIIVDIEGKRHDSAGALLAARSVTLASVERNQLHLTIEKEIHSGASAHVVAIVSIIAGSFAWLMSLYRREQASPLCPAVLLLAFLLFQLVFV